MSKECSDNQQEILARMMYWAKTNGIEIDTAVFFVKLAIEEMVNTKFNPGGPVAMYETSDSGISPLKQSIEGSLGDCSIGPLGVSSYMSKTRSKQGSEKK